MDGVKDFCNKPRVVHTGMGWGVRIDGTDVMEGVNQYGYKTLRTLDIAMGLSSEQEAETYLLQWLSEQIPELDAQRLRADTAEAERDALKDEIGQVKGEYDRAVNKVAAAEQRIAELENREVVAEAEGVLTFMRSDSDGCGCCEGHHVFCRYFEGVRSFDDFSQNTRFRNDLEGRRFRISIELMADAALNPNPETGSHE